MPTATKKPARIASSSKTQIVAPREVTIKSGHRGGFVAWSPSRDGRRISEGPTVEAAAYNASRRGWKVVS